MAKKRPNPTTRKPKVKLSPRDRKTMTRLTGLADRVVTAANGRRDPYVDIPSRTLSNIRYSPRKRILEMGSNKNRRQLFDLSQAKAYAYYARRQRLQAVARSRQNHELARFVLHAEAHDRRGQRKYL